MMLHIVDSMQHVPIPPEEAAVLIERLRAATMSTAEAAEFLGKPESTVRSYRWRGSGHGRLRSIRLGRAVRIYRCDVERYGRELEKLVAGRALDAPSSTIKIPTPTERTPE